MEVAGTRRPRHQKEWVPETSNRRDEDYEPRLFHGVYGALIWFWAAAVGMFESSEESDSVAIMPLLECLSMLLLPSPPKLHDYCD